MTRSKKKSLVLEQGSIIIDQACSMALCIAVADRALYMIRPCSVHPRKSRNSKARGMMVDCSMLYGDHVRPCTCVPVMDCRIGPAFRRLASFALSLAFWLPRPGRPSISVWAIFNFNYLFVQLYKTLRACLYRSGFFSTSFLIICHYICICSSFTFSSTLFA